MGEIILPGQVKEQKRCEMCMEAIRQACVKWNCQVVPMIQFIGPQVANFGFNVIPIPAVPPDIKSN